MQKRRIKGRRTKETRERKKNFHGDLGRRERKVNMDERRKKGIQTRA